MKMTTVIEASKITRLEVITEKGREFVQWDCSVDLSIQDVGRTLKIFVERKAAKGQGEEVTSQTPVESGEIPEQSKPELQLPSQESRMKRKGENMKRTILGWNV